MGLPRDQTIEQAINKIQNNLQTKCLTFGETAGTARDTDTETHTEGAVDLLENVNSEELENIFAAADIDDQRNVIG